MEEVNFFKLLLKFIIPQPIISSIIIKTLALTLFTFFPVLSFASPQKHAIIIAVGNYPKESGWQPINALNDVPVIKSALLKQGFLQKNIKVLSDAAATKQGIISALKQLAFDSKVGDVVFIHYSGHGQQITDDNGDEIDGYDESLIPFDARKVFIKGIYEGWNHLRDDELGAYINLLRTKVGSSGDVCIFLDACHSGTATRGMETCRGTEFLFQEPGYLPGSKANDRSVFFDNNPSREIMGKMSPVTIISGSGKLELNYEYFAADGKSYGSLSYAASKILSTITATVSYRALFENIRTEMAVIAPRQNPQIEGTPDRLILGGKAVRQSNYSTVDAWIDKNNVIISSGILSGLTINSIINFYPANTTDPSRLKPFVSGKISRVDILSAKVITQAPVSKETALNLWAFPIIQQHNIAEKLRLLNAENQTLASVIEIVPVTIRKQGNIYVEDKRFAVSSKVRKGQLVLIEGDCFKIGIKNKGSKTIYYQILDIQPDNRISLLVPFENRSPQEFYLRAGETRELQQIFTIGKPYGIEVFKLIATEKPLNIDFVSFSENSRSVAASQAETFVADLESKPGLTSKDQQIHIATLKFVIKPRN